MRITALLLAICLAPIAAHAQQPADAAAIATRRALLDEAQQARSRGDHAHALQSALSAARIEATASVTMFIAEEQQTLGQLAHSYESAQRCATLAENNAGIPNRGAILARCRELTDQLRPRIGLLNLRFTTPPAANVQVTVNQEAVSQPGSAPIAVQPGAVVVDASAGGASSFHREVSVGAGENTSVDVELSAAPAATPTTTASTASTASTAGGGASGPGPVPYVIAGVGAVALIAAIPFYLVRQNALGQCTQPDPTSPMLNCTQSQYNTANTFNLLTNVAWIGGAVLLAGGVTWWLVARFSSHPAAPSERARRTWSPSAFVLPEGGAIVGLGGTL
jgi:hypothetical protein